MVAEEHGYFAQDTVRGFRFQLDDGEKILGGGQRVMGMDRRGRRMPLYNKASYGYETETDQMYYGLPAVVSSDKYTIVFDNSASGWLDIGHTEDDVLKFEAVGGRTAYLVIAGKTYPELLENYTDVTGRQPLPPRWAFGNYASRFGYHTEAETRDVVRRFRRADIPLDAIILDIYWFGPDIKGHMGNLDWDRNAWPDPEKMISDFAKQGIKTIAITEPFILSTSDQWQSAVDNEVLAKTPTGEPRRFDFYFGNTGLVDVFDEKAQDWFWQPYEMLFEQGTAATWGDLGEPEVHPGDSLHWLSEAQIEATGDEVHNAYGHAWARMVFERQIEKYPAMRPLILMRSGFAGSQRGVSLRSGETRAHQDQRTHVRIFLELPFEHHPGPGVAIGIVDFVAGRLDLRVAQPVQGVAGMHPPVRRVAPGCRRALLKEHLVGMRRTSPVTARRRHRQGRVAEVKSKQPVGVSQAPRCRRRSAIARRAR